MAPTRFPAISPHVIVAAQTPERIERRKRTRMQVHWSLYFEQSATAEVAETTTHNLSSDGFYCHTRTRFVPGEIRTCTLGVPTRHPDLGTRVRLVQCRVRVIWVDSIEETGLWGVGFQLEDYKFLDAETATPVLAD